MRMEGLPSCLGCRLAPRHPRLEGQPTPRRFVLSRSFMRFLTAENPVESMKAGVFRGTNTNTQSSGFVCKSLLFPSFALAGRP